MGMTGGKGSNRVFDWDCEEDWGPWRGYREDRGMKQGSREHRAGRQGSEELSGKGKRRRYWPVMTAGDGRFYFIPMNLWFKVIDLGSDGDDEKGDAPNDAHDEPKIDWDELRVDDENG
jgi:hypothetical protein